MKLTVKLTLTIIAISLFSCMEPIRVVNITPQTSDAVLSSVSINGDVLSDFSPLKFDYSLTVDTPELVINALSSNTKTKIYYHTNITLTKPYTEVSILVISEDATRTNVYTLKLYYYSDTINALKTIRINGSQISNFNPLIHNYTVRVPKKYFTIDALSIDPSVTPAGIGYKEIPEDENMITVDIIVSGLTYKISVIFIETGTGSGYYNPVDLSYEFQQDGFTTVITGDSLSISHGFIEGNLQSTDTYTGILGWSQMLRDAIWRNDPGFVHADELLIGAKNSSTAFNKSWDGVTPYMFPFNNRSLTIVTKSSDDEVRINYSNIAKPSGKIYLYLGKTPKGVGCSFKVKLNGEYKNVKVYDFYDNIISPRLSSNTTDVVDISSKSLDRNKGYEVIVVEIPDAKVGNNIITLTDFVNTATLEAKSSDFGFFLLGAGSKYSPVHITGRGSVTTQFFIDNDYLELNNRVLRYDPDYVIMIIGANDSCNPNALPAGSGLMSVETYKANLIRIVEKIKEKNENTGILLMSPPEWSDDWDNNLGISVEDILPYVDAMREVAQEYRLSFVNMVEFFQGFPVGPGKDGTGKYPVVWRDWRSDFVHFSHYGHTILGRSIINMLMPNGIYDITYADSSNVFRPSTNFNVPKHGWTIVKYNKSTLTFDTMEGFERNLIKSINTSAGQSFMSINTHHNDFSSLSRLSVTQYGGNQFEFYTRPNTSTEQLQTFFILKRGYKSDGSTYDYLMSDADFNTYENHLKFLISW